MPIPIQILIAAPDNFTDAVKGPFTDIVLEILRANPDTAFSSGEIAATMRRQAGISDELKLMLDVLGIFEPEVNQLTDSPKRGFEAALNSLLQSQMISVAISDGTAYFWYS